MQVDALFLPAGSKTKPHSKNVCILSLNNGLAHMIINTLHNQKVT